MTGRPWLRTFGLAIALASAAAAAQQQDLSNVQVQTHKLSESTYMLTGAGGNLGVSIGPDAVFVVDDQFAPMTPKIQAAIAKLTDKPVQFVINTHWHFDHTGGNENFAKAGAVIVAHDNVRRRMSASQFIQFLAARIEPSSKAALPVIGFATEVTFHLNGDEIHVFHVPNSHTDGDAIVHFRRSNVIHLGDVYFNGMYPFIDASSGGTIDGTIAAVDKVLAIAGDDTRLIPGHGPVATKAQLKAYRDMLADVGANVKAQIRDGKTLEQVIAAKPTAAYDAEWGKGFLPTDKWVAMLYQMLAGGR